MYGRRGRSLGIASVIFIACIAWRPARPSSLSDLCDVWGTVAARRHGGGGGPAGTTTTEEDEKSGLDSSRRCPDGGDDDDYDDDYDDDDDDYETNAVVVGSSLRNMTGTWMGDWWIPPPGWRLFSPSELRGDVFSNRSGVLWLGDSTARRAAMSLYALLNHTRGREGGDDVDANDLDGKHVIDVNKGGSVTEPCERFGTENATLHRPAICRPMPDDDGVGTAGDGRYYNWIELSCLAQLETFLADELNDNSTMTADVDVVVVSMGIWHHVRPLECNRMDPRKRSMEALLGDVLGSLLELSRRRREENGRDGLSIIWRTSGFSDDGSNHKVIYRMNDIVMDYMDGHRRQQQQRCEEDGCGGSGLMTYVNWGGAVEGRSFRERRIKGDIKPHYGLQPRLVLGQMIANTLHDHHRQQRLRRRRSARRSGGCSSHGAARNVGSGLFAAGEARERDIGQVP